MKKLLLLLLLLIIPINTVSAKEEINVYVFYGDGCSFCEKLLSYMSTLENDDEYNDKYELVAYEVWHDSENIKLKNEVGKYFNYESNGVPFYIIGENYFVGYSSDNNEKIKNTIISEYNKQNYIDVVDKVIKDNKLNPHPKQKTSYIVDITDEYNTIQNPPTAKTDEEIIEEEFNKFIYNLNIGGKDIFDSIDLDNKNLEANIKEYLKKIDITTTNTKIKKISNDKYKLVTVISAEGDTWEISGIKVEFTYEKGQKGFVITNTNLFDFVGTKNVLKLVKWILIIVFGSITVISIIIITIVIISTRKKKTNVDENIITE